MICSRDYLLLIKFDRFVDFSVDIEYLYEINNLRYARLIKPDATKEYYFVLCQYGWT